MGQFFQWTSAKRNDSSAKYIKSLNSIIAAVSLQNCLKASRVVSCNNSSNGWVFEYPFTIRNRSLKFLEVLDLSCQEIVCVPGTQKHFLQVSKRGRVFCGGSNDYGQFGLGKRRGLASGWRLSFIFCDSRRKSPLMWTKLLWEAPPQQCL